MVANDFIVSNFAVVC